MGTHNEIGKKGEELATEYLLANHYQILERNWRYQKAEIDIIAQKNNHLIIAEVKTRSINYLAAPEEAISKAKQRQLILGAEAYIAEKDIQLECRFDVISIIHWNDRFEISHLKDAFAPGLE